MRSVKFLTILGFVLLTSISLIIIGCGSDDAPPTTSNAGSFTDANFVAVQGLVESMLDSTIAFVFAGMQSATTVSGDDGVIPTNYVPTFSDIDQINITYINGWHVVDLTHSTADIAFNVLDSVQFYNDDAISQLGTGADSIWYRHYWSYNVQNKDVSYTEYEGASGFDLRGLDGSTAVIDGYNEIVVDNQYVSVDSTVFRHFESSTTIESLSVNETAVGWAQACPNSGTIASTVSMIYSKDDSPEVTTQWVVSVTFNDGLAAVTVTNSGLVWRYTAEVCTSIN